MTQRQSEHAAPQSNAPRVGFIGWGAESARAWSALVPVSDAACWLPPSLSPASAPAQLPRGVRTVGSIEALFTTADWLFLEGDPLHYTDALHTVRLAMSDRHLLALLGPHWHLGTLLEQLNDRKLMRCMLIATGQGSAELADAAAGRSVGFSAIAMVAAATVPPNERAAFRSLFRAARDVVELREEAQFEVMQSLGGFAPAAFLTVLDSMADGVRMLGVPRPEAVRLLAALLQDEVSALLSGQRSLADMREAALEQEVAATGLMELEVAGLRGHLMRAVHQAVRHARELSQGNKPD